LSFKAEKTVLLLAYGTQEVQDNKIPASLL